MNHLLDSRRSWYVPLQVLGKPGAITSSARSALPATAPPEDLCGTAYENTSTVLVFERVEDAELYYRIYFDHALRDNVMLQEHVIHQLTPQQVRDTFMIPPKTRRDVMLVPVPVFAEDAQEFLDAFNRSASPHQVGKAVAIITKKVIDRASRP